ncbi:hypothetical protein HYX16_01470 [Candidatus Woesearchaeota archaeon]|nr:hypothetical protein [Candidatus Woesearchaeota archaeon]
MNNILWLKEISDIDLDKVGNRAIIISKISRNDIPVLNGFCIPKEFFISFLEETNIKDEINKALNGLNVNEINSLYSVSEKIQNLIMKSEMPLNLRAEIKEAYENINVDKDVYKTAGRQTLEIIRSGRGTPDVVVKTSCPNNNLPQIKIINVRGKEDLMQSIKKCWASLFTANCLKQKSNNNIELEYNLISVMVQKMIDSDKSGMIRTINTEKDNDDKIIIEACLGDVETITTGSITPDKYTLNKENLELVEKIINKQDFMIVRDDALGKNIKRSIFDGGKQKLTEEEINRLGLYALRIEKLYENPQDIEFCISKDKIFILDCKPIEINLSKNIVKQEENITNNQLTDYYDTATEVKVIIKDEENIIPDIERNDGIGLLKIEVNEDNAEKIMKDIETRILYFKNKPIWYYLNYSLENVDFLNVQFEAIKRLHDKGFTNIGIAIPNITDVSQIKRIKDMLKEIKLEPLEEIELGIIIDSPASSILIEEICEEGIDFIMIDMEKLTTTILNINNKKYYNEYHPAVLKQLSSIIKTCRKQNIETSAFGGNISDPELIDLLVKKGIDSIICEANSITETRNSIAKTEKKIILRRVAKEEVN